MAPYFFALPFSQTFVLFKLEVPCHPLSDYSEVRGIQQTVVIVRGNTQVHSALRGTSQ